MRFSKRELENVEREKSGILIKILQRIFVEFLREEKREGSTNYDKIIFTKTIALKTRDVKSVFLTGN